jgi:CRP/FNR family transcriptional regulator, polysaccharide utilization system transcription regulator
MNSNEKTAVPIDQLNPMWTVITPEERMYLRENTRTRRYRKGDIIYREGDIPHYMICIISGCVKIYRDGIGGRSQIIRFIKPTENFGYCAAFAQDAYSTSAAAIETTEAYLVPVSVMKQIVQANNKLAIHFVHALAKDLCTDDMRIVSLTQKHIRGRLAESLLVLRNNYGFDTDGRTINCRLSREDLANFSNMTTANAIRTLSSFASEGLINIKGRYITLNDEEALQKISKMG